MCLCSPPARTTTAPCAHRARNTVHRADAADHSGRKPPAQLGGGRLRYRAQSRLCAPWAASCAQSMAFSIDLDDPAATVTAAAASGPVRRGRAGSRLGAIVLLLVLVVVLAIIFAPRGPTRPYSPRFLLLRAPRAPAPAPAPASAALPRRPPKPPRPPRSGVSAASAFRPASAALRAASVRAGGGFRSGGAGRRPGGGQLPLRRRFVPRRRGQAAGKRDPTNSIKTAPRRVWPAGARCFYAVFGVGEGAAYTSASSPRGARFQVRIDEPVQVAVHHGLYVAVFKAGAVVLDQRVGHEHIAAGSDAPEAISFCTPLMSSDLVLVLLQRDLGTAWPSSFPSRIRVL